MQALKPICIFKTVLNSQSSMSDAFPGASSAGVTLACQPSRGTQGLCLIANTRKVSYF